MKPSGEVGTTTVLIAEDDLVSQHLLRSFLIKSGYHVITVTDGLQALEALQAADGPHLAILGWMMPIIEGPEVCKRIRQMPGRPYTYILLITARTRPDDLLEGLGAGADDYLTKPFDVLEVLARLRVGQRILDLQDSLLRTREALRLQAAHDALTGVYNRAAILEVMAREDARHRREGSFLGIVMIDVDHFKRVNDTHGHVVGDEILEEMTRRIERCVRCYDAVGRYGGEEFLIVAPNVNEAHALGLAERVRRAIQETPFEAKAAVIPVTASLGVAVSNGNAPEAFEDPVRRAEEALYRAKKLGRNRCEIAGGGPSNNETCSASTAPQSAKNEDAS